MAWAPPENSPAHPSSPILHLHFLAINRPQTAHKPPTKQPAPSIKTAYNLKN